MMRNVVVSVATVAIMWLIFAFNQVFPIELNNYGIVPRTTQGLWGIVCAPFLHADFNHLLSNSGAVIILTFLLLTFYENLAFKVWTLSIFMGGFMVWLFCSPDTVHIGASGLVFALIGFLLASGLFRGSFKAFFVALGVFFVYGGVWVGVLPTMPGISWQSHLFGMLSGVFLAYYYRRVPSERVYRREPDRGGDW